MGMVNYFSQFIRNQSETTAPLVKPVEERCSLDLLTWAHTGSGASKGDPAKSACFKVLSIDPFKPVKLQVDAFKSGLGACILQDGHPIAYASRSLTQA